MKLGFIGYNDPAGVEADARFAATHGFDGLEYNYWGDFRDLTLETVTAMRRTLDAHGVGTSALGLWGWNHLAPDPAVRAEAHEMLGRAIEFAQTLGAEALITGGGVLTEEAIEPNVEEFAKVFPPFLERMAGAGLTPAMYAVHGNSFFDCIEAFQQVWERLPQVGIKFDPANWRHHGDDYLAVLRDHGDKISYVHIKEHLYMDGELAAQPAAGMGDIEWGKVLAFLYEHDYRGYLSFEPHGPHWSREPLRSKMLLLSRKHLEQFLL
ncbi:MAG: sugar phosphate isomerase/epimerase [Armatimonadetes bacterium]|nr:sugar phosphate isomerase/epimerase [Armatimonadota bacterium]